MRERRLPWLLAGLLTLAGCSRPPWTYRQSFVTRGESGRVLVVLDNSRVDFLSTVDLATGARSERAALGTAGSCLPASPGRIWCGYTAGTVQFEHEAWDLSPLAYVADNASITEEASSGLTAEGMQRQEGVRIRRSDHALVLIGDGMANQYFAVDPRTFAVSTFSLGSSEAETLWGNEHDDALVGVTEYSVTVGDRAYWLDIDVGQLQTAPAGSHDWQPLSGEEAFPTGQIVLADGLDAASGPLVAQGPESLFVSAYLGPDMTGGCSISRVATADGAVLWRMEAPDAQYVDAVTGEGDLVVVSLRLRDAGKGEHGRVVGLDMGTGEARWEVEL